MTKQKPKKIMPLDEWFGLIEQLHGRPVTLLIRVEADYKLTLLAAGSSVHSLDVLLDHKADNILPVYVG